MLVPFQGCPYFGFLSHHLLTDSFHSRQDQLSLTRLGIHTIGPFTNSDYFTVPSPPQLFAWLLIASASYPEPFCFCALYNVLHVTVNSIKVRTECPKQCTILLPAQEIWGWNLAFHYTNSAPYNKPVDCHDWSRAREGYKERDLAKAVNGSLLGKFTGSNLWMLQLLNLWTL